MPELLENLSGMFTAAPTGTEPVLISALNEYVFCPRRCALKFVEGWRADNEHTALGTLLHEHADDAGYETGEGVKLLRGLPLFSRRYGITGKADIVEMRSGVPAPVEYKKGRRRKFENDDIQLCAQGLCLEEMFSTVVPEGFIYHAASKRRRKVVFDERLRLETEETIQAVRQLIAQSEVPSAVLKPRCDGCSLRSVCMPELTGARMLPAYKREARALWQE
jgi:CRISPR-associated exonuclease Cas4